MKVENITEIHIPNNLNPIVMGGLKEVELFDIMYIEAIKYYVEKYNMKFENKGIRLDIWLAEVTKAMEKGRITNGMDIVNKR